MKPVFQTVSHVPEDGKYGDCYRACIASMLDMHIEHVPHFYGERPEDTFWECQDRVRIWLCDRGLSIFMFQFAGREDRLKPLLDAMKLWNPRLYYILSGEGIPSGFSHAVIAKEDKIVHDPNPEGRGVKPYKEEGENEGLYTVWIEVIVPINPKDVRV